MPINCVRNEEPSRRDGGGREREREREKKREEERRRRRRRRRKTKNKSKRTNEHLKRCRQAGRHVYKHMHIKQA